MIEKSAVFSPCRKYRYELNRTWKLSKGICLFVCLNPSTADENVDDPTIRRCIRYADSWGLGAMTMVNLFAHRATNPNELRKVEDPIGPENYNYIQANSDIAALTIAAWGAHKLAQNSSSYVIRFLKNPHYLELTKGGMPKHPLYLKKDLKPMKC